MTVTVTKIMRKTVYEITMVSYLTRSEKLNEALGDGKLTCGDGNEASGEFAET